MLLSSLLSADVIAIIICGYDSVADVIATMADGIAIDVTKNSYMVVPYYQGHSESIKRSCKKYGVQVHFKGGLNIRNLLMAPKDKDHILKKSGVIYRYRCDRVECDEEYIGESTRTFTERFKEHLKAPSPIHDHSN